MRRAYIIEDDYDASFIFARALAENGYEVESFHDGQDALDHLAEAAAPQLILLDLNLPSVNGVEILAYIRSQSTFDATKVVVVTANPRMIDETRHAADLVILKPSSYTQIRDFIKRLSR